MTIARSSYGNFTNFGYAVNPAIISMKTNFHKRKYL
jgi:hypothetical protein